MSGLTTVRTASRSTGNGLAEVKETGRVSPPIRLNSAGAFVTVVNCLKSPLRKGVQAESPARPTRRVETGVPSRSRSARVRAPP